MANPFVAEVRVFPFNFAPTGWAFCNGQLLSISQNTALFSLLGTFYGGDGKSNFALPNLQGDVAIGQGQGPGLSDYVVGESAGSQTVTLLTSEMPAHAHVLMADTDNGPDNTSPSGAALSSKGSAPATAIYTSATSPIVQMNAAAVTPLGGNQPHNNMMPFLCLNFCIALQGVFPPRS